MPQLTWHDLEICSQIRWLHTYQVLLDTQYSIHTGELLAGIDEEFNATDGSLDFDLAAFFPAELIPAFTRNHLPHEDEEPQYFMVYMHSLPR